MAAFAVPAFAVTPETYHVIEAESCRVADEHRFPTGFLWASAGGQVHEFWGEETADSISFDFEIPDEQPPLNLGVRYSYNMHHYLGYRGRPASVEGIVLEIDGVSTVPLKMPDTGDWHIYELLEAHLPRLSPGKHSFNLRSIAEGSVRNIDCFVLYRSRTDVPSWLRSSVAHREKSGRFWVLASPGVKPGARVTEFVRFVDRAWKFYTEYYGREAPKPLKLHVIADKNWDNPGATAYQNNAGLFFPESTFDKDLGNILHEMTHWFNVGRLPAWLDEPAVRALTTFVWAPELISNNDPALDKRVAELKKSAVSREPVGSLEDVLAMMIAVHGRDLFRKFWHSIHDAEREGKLDAGKTLTRAQVVTYLSKAAGADVSPLLERWPGFKQAE